MLSRKILSSMRNPRVYEEKTTVKPDGGFFL
jgi:hypothetical protein